MSCFIADADKAHDQLGRVESAPTNAANDLIASKKRKYVQRKYCRVLQKGMCR